MHHLCERYWWSEYLFSKNFRSKQHVSLRIGIPFTLYFTCREIRNSDPPRSCCNEDLIPWQKRIMDFQGSGEKSTTEYTICCRLYSLPLFLGLTIPVYMYLMRFKWNVATSLSGLVFFNNTILAIPKFWSTMIQSTLSHTLIINPTSPTNFWDALWTHKVRLGWEKSNKQ